MAAKNSFIKLVFIDSHYYIYYTPFISIFSSITTCIKRSKGFIKAREGFF